MDHKVQQDKQEAERPAKGLMPTQKPKRGLFFSLFIRCSFNTAFCVLRMHEQRAGFGDAMGK